jgi:hypothetical protein
LPPLAGDSRIRKRHRCRFSLLLRHPLLELRLWFLKRRCKLAARQLLLFPAV